MDWKKAIGFAFLFYLIIFVIDLVFAIFDKSDSVGSEVFLLIVMITLLVYLTYLLKPKNVQAKIYFGLLVVTVTFIIELGLVIPSSGWEYLQSWWTWFIYALIFITPLCVPSAHLAIQTKPNNSLKKQ